MIPLAVTRYEQELLEDIEEIAYGELYNVQVERETPTKVIELPERFARLLKEIRRGKQFVKLVIHESEPTIGEYWSITGHGRKCLVKIKF
jgi:hypothetical protein